MGGYTLSMKVASLVVLAALALAPVLARPNDSAAAVAAGGIVLKEERRVSLLKERLGIKAWTEMATSHGRPYEQDRFRVSVEYEFINNSTEEVATTVAFPVPEYGWGGFAAVTNDFGVFRAWVDGREIEVEKEVRLFTDGGREVTQVFKELGIPEGPYPGWEGDSEPQPGWYARFGPRVENGLIDAGLIKGGFYPQWTRRVTWHWPQRFPPGKVVSVRHEYKPEFGFDLTRVDEVAKVHADGCIDPKLATTWKWGPAGSKGQYVSLAWVNYILRTANNWQQPIKDFELTVERPEGWVASFCWDGPIEQVSPKLQRARAKDFVPKKDLIVYFRPKL